MNLSLPFFCGFLGVLALVAAWRPKYLFAILPICLLVVPSVRTFIGSAPFYCYDAAAIAILARLYLSRDLQHWPAALPRWHWWFLGCGLLFGTLVPLLRYGADAELWWIFGHAGIAWMAFPAGMALTVAPGAQEYRKFLSFGLLVALTICAVVATLEFGNERMAAVLNGFYFQDMKGHLVLLDGVGAKLSSSRVNGPFGDPNTFGGTTAVACAICLMLFASRSKKLALIALSAAAIVVGATVSRQVLVAVAAGGAVAFAFGTGRLRLRVLGAAVLLVFIGIASGVASNWGARLAKWEGGIGEDMNVVGRLVIGPMRLFTLIGEKPQVLLTGVGLDVQKLAKKAGNAEEVGIYLSGTVSNGFLLPLYGMGIAGFLLTLAFWFWTLRKSLQWGTGTRALAAGCVVTAMALIASDNYSYFSEVTVALLFMLAALASCESKRDSERISAPASVPCVASNWRPLPANG